VKFVSVNFFIVKVFCCVWAEVKRVEGSLRGDACSLLRPEALLLELLLLLLHGTFDRGSCGSGSGFVC
jgi:hypothetical protein